MITAQVAKQELATIVWEEGKTEPVVSGPYRYQVVIVCSSVGRQKAIFADGCEHNYFAFARIVNGKGEWNGEGGIIVPVLPNGRLLMVVEQRPPAYQFKERGLSDRIFLDTGDVPLSSFGPYSSLEFPSGAVEMNEASQSGILRELQEETGAFPFGQLYRKTHPIVQMVSDVAARDHLAVIFLEGIKYVPHTKDDGGLTILALTPEEVERNIWKGTISSAHAGILPFSFYREIVGASPKRMKEMVEGGYLIQQEIKPQVV